jgi:hypothetical protein
VASIGPVENGAFLGEGCGPKYLKIDKKILRFYDSFKKVPSPF